MYSDERPVDINMTIAIPQVCLTSQLNEGQMWASFSSYIEAKPYAAKNWMLLVGMY
jgi:hypothetical protein